MEQGLFEVGLFSTFIPGREVPKGWLSNNGSSSRAGCSYSSLSFTVPSCSSIPNDRRRIRCLNVCSVYALSNEEQIWWRPPLFTKVSNKTKDLKWIYGPRYFPIPEGEEHVMWLSQWKNGNQFRLEVGDEMNVTVVADVCFQVKGCGINILFEENEEEEKTLQQLDTAHPNCQGVSFPEWSWIGGAYLSGQRCNISNKREDPMVNRYDWVSSTDWGKKLFEDSTLTAEEVIEEFENRSRIYAEAYGEALAKINKRGSVEPTPYVMTIG